MDSQNSLVSDVALVLVPSVQVWRRCWCDITYAYKNNMQRHSTAKCVCVCVAAKFISYTKWLLWVAWRYWNYNWLGTFYIYYNCLGIGQSKGNQASFNVKLDFVFGCTIFVHFTISRKLNICKYLSNIILCSKVKFWKLNNLVYTLILYKTKVRTFKACIK